MRPVLVVPAIVAFTLAAACGPSSAPKAPETSSGTPATADAAAGTSPAGASGSKTGQACGGMAGLGCKPGLYCSYPPGAQCGAADQTGTCEPMAGAICTMEFAPVCGCDGKTYPNACHAAQQGVSVLDKGDCKDQQAP